MASSWPQRKKNRLSACHYNEPGAYFITICTLNRQNLFWVNGNARTPQNVLLTRWGAITERCIREIPKRYAGECCERVIAAAYNTSKQVHVSHHVVMPNHIHLLLQIHALNWKKPDDAPNVSRIIQQLKGTVSKQAGVSLWQKGFHDHIIRTEEDYRDIWTYIEHNPARWHEDQLYSAETTAGGP